MIAAIVILAIALFFIRIIGWSLLKLRLLVPVLYIIVWYSCMEKDWAIINFLGFVLIKDKLRVGDLIGILMLLYAAVMFIHDIFAPVIEWLSPKKRSRNVNGDIISRLDEEDEYIVITKKDLKQIAAQYKDKDSGQTE